MLIFASIEVGGVWKPHKLADYVNILTALSAKVLQPFLICGDNLAFVQHDVLFSQEEKRFPLLRLLNALTPLSLAT